MSQAHALPSQPLAPWAEVVPDTPRMTTDDLAALPEDGWQYELVEGVLVRMPMSGGEASNIAMRLVLQRKMTYSAVQCLRFLTVPFALLDRPTVANVR